MNQKRNLQGIFGMTLLLVVLYGCAPDPVPTFSVSDIYGTWQDGTLHYRYDRNYEGVTWNVADDVYESEGQRFRWSIEGEDMEHIYIMEMGESAIPKTYTIDELTPKVLRYHDDFKDYEFTKVY